MVKLSRLLPFLVGGTLGIPLGAELQAVNGAMFQSVSCRMLI